MDEFICELFSLLLAVPAWAFRLSSRRPPDGGGMEHMATARAMRGRLTIPSLRAVLGCASSLCNFHVIPGRAKHEPGISRFPGLVLPPSLSELGRTSWTIPE